MFQQENRQMADRKIWSSLSDACRGGALKQLSMGIWAAMRTVTQTCPAFWEAYPVDPICLLIFFF